jgi:hypothetical protein
VLRLKTPVDRVREASEVLLFYASIPPSLGVTQTAACHPICEQSTILASFTDFTTMWLTQDEGIGLARLKESSRSEAKIKPECNE